MDRFIKVGAFVIIIGVFGLVLMGIINFVVLRHSPEDSPRDRVGTRAPSQNDGDRAAGEPVGGGPPVDDDAEPAGEHDHVREDELAPEYLHRIQAGQPFGTDSPETGQPADDTFEAGEPADDALEAGEPSEGVETVEPFEAGEPGENASEAGEPVDDGALEAGEPADDEAFEADEPADDEPFDEPFDAGEPADMADELVDDDQAPEGDEALEDDVFEDDQAFDDDEAFEDDQAIEDDVLDADEPGFDDTDIFEDGLPYYPYPGVYRGDVYRDAEGRLRIQEPVFDRPRPESAPQPDRPTLRDAPRPTGPGEEFAD